MIKPVTRLFDNRAQAEAAVRDLEASGIAPSRLSLIVRDKHGRSALDHTEAADGAGMGAATGGVLGGGAGLLAGLGMLAIPGLGPVVAAGWLAAALTGAAVGAVAGAATGGVLGALKAAGHTEEDAHVFAEGVRRGGALVSVRPQSEVEAVGAEGILARHNGVDAQTRGADFRQTGWTRFDESAQV